MLIENNRGGFSHEEEKKGNGDGSQRCFGHVFIIIFN